MKLRFSLRTYLIFIAFLAMTLNAMGVLFRIVSNHDGKFRPGVEWLAASPPLVIPIIFASHAIDRKTVTFRMLVVYLVAMAIAIGLFNKVW
jgi:hypothetical protein